MNHYKDILALYAIILSVLAAILSFGIAGIMIVIEICDYRQSKRKKEFKISKEVDDLLHFNKTETLF